MENHIYRNELKYSCSEMQMTLIYMKLKNFMIADANETEGNYHISSLYFDDMFNSAYLDNENGYDHREKYRIRMYNYKSADMKLELKGKRHGMTYKQSVPINKKEYLQLMNHNLAVIQKKAFRFYCQIMMKGLQPKIIVDYDRTALTLPEGNLRITFDKNITASQKTEQFLTGKYPEYPIMPSGMHILEVKYDTILPFYIKDLLEGGFMEQISFSKFYYSMH